MVAKVLAQRYLSARMNTWRSPQANERPEPVTDQSIALAEWFIDPINRYYRYPLCKILVKPLIYSKLRPNHISMGHFAVAVLAAFCMVLGGRIGMIVGAVLYELRNVLDCLDGELARAQGTGSLQGAVMDEVMDGLGFFALLAAYGVLLSQHGLSLASTLLTLLLLLVCSTLMAMNYVMQKNRFHAPLTKGINAVEIIMHERRLAAQSGRVGDILVYAIEISQNLASMPMFFGELMAAMRQNRPTDRREVRYLIAKANSPILKSLIGFLSLATGETVILILLAGLWVNDLVGASKAVIAFAVLTFPLSVLLTNAYLAPAHKLSSKLQKP